jgi:hypothetical protein
MAYMRGALLAVVLILAACGSGSRPQAQSSIQASPSAPSGLLFAVVEGGSFESPDTVAIVGPDGSARAKATFQPRTMPGIPDAYVPLPGVAKVINSSVYYIDGAGTVRVLRVGSQPQVLARFAQQPAQEDTWFAVSPDGSRIAAGILTFPGLGPTPSGSAWQSLVGPTTFSLETAPAGGQSVTLVHWETPIRFPQGSTSPTAIFPVGWASAGLVAMLPEYLTSQNAWPGGPLYVIDDAGKKTRQLGGSDCSSASITANGLIPCISGVTVAVRDQGGNVIWTTHVDSFSALDLHVSPDGQAISDIHQVETRVGGIVPMPTGFRVEGWLDSNTVIGRVTSDPNTVGGPNEGNLLWISLGDPGTLHDLGFKGDFVATLA